MDVWDIIETTFGGKTVSMGKEDMHNIAVYVGLISLTLSSHAFAGEPKTGAPQIVAGDVDPSIIEQLSKHPVLILSCQKKDKLQSKITYSFRVSKYGLVRDIGPVGDKKSPCLELTVIPRHIRNEAVRGQTVTVTFDFDAAKKLRENREEARLEEERKKEAALPSFPKFWKGLEWGQSMKSVKAEARRWKPKPAMDVQSDRITFAKLRIANRDAGAQAVFTGGKLAQYIILFQEKRINAEKYVTDFRALKKLLTKKYGEPFHSSEGASMFSTKKTETRLGQKILLGEAEMNTIWRTKETTILMKLSAENMNVSYSLLYQSRALGAAAEKQREEEDLDDL